MARALAAGIAVLGSAIGIAACGTGSSEPLGRAFGALDTPTSSTTTTTAPSSALGPDLPLKNWSRWGFPSVMLLAFLVKH